MNKLICSTLLLFMLVSNTAIAGHAATRDDDEHSAIGFYGALLGGAAVTVIGTAVESQKEIDRAGVISSDDDMSREDEAKCKELNMNGPYYRYELEYKHVVQAIEKGIIYGQPIKGGGRFPYVKAYYKKEFGPRGEEKENEVKFCTAATGHRGGAKVILFGAKDQGVVLINEELVMIEVKVID